MTDSMTPENARARQLRERAERDYALFQSAVGSTGETWFPPGTEAILGKASIHRARAEFDKLPDAHDALPALAAAVQSENRLDIPATFGMGPSDADTLGDLPKMAIYPSVVGGWTVDAKGGFQDDMRLTPTERAWQQMSVKRPEGHPAAAMDVNAWIGSVPKHAVVARTRTTPAARASLGPRECYAMVSPGYKPYDLDAAANDLLSACPSGSRARIRYDGARARVDVVLQNPYRLDGTDAAGVGETHRVVLRMRTADDGSGGYHLSLLAERVRCINLSLLHAGKSLLKATHRSDGLRDLAAQALALVEPQMKAFQATWAEAWNSYYCDKHTSDLISAEDALTRIVRLSKFRISGQGEDGTLAAVLAALKEEPGDTRAHVHNAMTRAAHTVTTGWSSRWCDDEAEEQASQLLYQHVYRLPSVEA